MKEDDDGLEALDTFKDWDSEYTVFDKVITLSTIICILALLFLAYIL